MDKHAASRAGELTEVKLSRDLGFFSITMIGVGAMIGAGIFVLTGIAAGAAGPALILSFALNAIVTVFTAMVYAELGSAIPEAGGGYLWVKEGLPGPNAFQAGWMSWHGKSRSKKMAYWPQKEETAPQTCTPRSSKSRSSSRVSLRFLRFF